MVFFHSLKHDSRASLNHADLPGQGKLFDLLNKEGLERVQNKREKCVFKGFSSYLGSIQTNRVPAFLYHIEPIVVLATKWKEPQGKETQQIAIVSTKHPPLQTIVEPQRMLANPLIWCPQFCGANKNVFFECLAWYTYMI